MRSFKASFLMALLAGVAGWSAWAQIDFTLLTSRHEWGYFQAGSAPPGNGMAPTYASSSGAVSLEEPPDIYPPGIIAAVAQETGASNTIQITFTENLLRASATNLANYTLTLEGTTNQVVVSNASHFLNMVSLRVGGSNWLWGSNYVLTVRGVCDLRTNCLVCCSNRVRVAYFQELFPFEGVSKYFNTAWAREVLRTNYVFWDLSWAHPDYDDSDPNLWPTGLGGAYYASLNPSAEPCAPLTTDMGCYYEDVLTYYFRTRFVAPSNTGRATLLIRYWFDNDYFMDGGAVFYLNGMEIGRLNMPSGPVTPHTCASNLTIVEFPCTEVFSVAVTNLRSGPNVLAAELHEGCSAAVHDLYYAVQIRAALFEPLGGDPPALSITRVTADGLPTNAVASTHVQVAWDAASASGWHLYMATNVAGPWTLVATNSPFRTEVSPQVARFFTLRQAR